MAIREIAVKDRPRGPVERPEEITAEGIPASRIAAISIRASNPTSDPGENVRGQAKRALHALTVVETRPK